VRIRKVIVQVEEESYQNGWRERKKRRKKDAQYILGSIIHVYLIHFFNQKKTQVPKHDAKNVVIYTVPTRS
jgi:hypothetical protein